MLISYIIVHTTNCLTIIFNNVTIKIYKIYIFRSIETFGYSHVAVHDVAKPKIGFLCFYIFLPRVFFDDSFSRRTTIYTEKNKKKFQRLKKRTVFQPLENISRRTTFILFYVIRTFRKTVCRKKKKKNNIKLFQYTKYSQIYVL